MTLIMMSICIDPYSLLYFYWLLNNHIVRSDKIGPVVVCWSLASKSDWLLRQEVYCYVVWALGVFNYHAKVDQFITNESSQRYLQYHCWLLYCLMFANGFCLFAAMIVCVSVFVFVIVILGIILMLVWNWYPCWSVAASSLVGRIGSIRKADCWRSNRYILAVFGFFSIMWNAYLD